MKHIQNYTNFNEKYHDDLITLNDYNILSLISKSRGVMRYVLKLISERLNNGYIVINYQDCVDIIDDLKSMNFDIKIYDDSNEYSENFDDKVKISWNVDDVISDDDYSGE